MRREVRRGERRRSGEERERVEGDEEARVDGRIKGISLSNEARVAERDAPS